MQGFLADGTSRRYIGPRKDIAMASRGNASRFNSEKLFSLLSSKPQTEYLELLSFDLALQPIERWRALVSLWAFSRLRASYYSMLQPETRYMALLLEGCF